MKKRIFGITGDRAFAKGNKPFKTMIVTLLGKEITIRWDILHLINRAHKDARGEAKYDEEHQEDLEADDVDANIESDATTQQIEPKIAQLINYVQVRHIYYDLARLFTEVLAIEDMGQSLFFILTADS